MRKIAIVGTAPSSYQRAPFADPEWEIWTCSALAMEAPRWDRHFELHEFEEVARGWTASPETDMALRMEYLKRLSAASEHQRVVLKEREPAIPQSMAYPREEAREWAQGDYFASTISYMIAMAALEGVQEIGIWGVDMALREEQYSGQRGSIEYLIGLCRGRGITVTVPPECDLLKLLEPYAYGSSSEFARRLKAKKAEVDERMKAIGEQLQQGERMKIALAGAADVLDWVQRSWTHE